MQTTGSNTLVLTLLLCASTSALHAQTPASGSVESITVTASPPAQQLAPSGPPIDETEPTSVIGAQTLDKLAVPTEDYNDLVRLTPSATDVSPVGPGLQQDFGQSIRGLQYTQFSVLYDDIQIPGFPFNGAPQPGAYFMENDIGKITVQRGPAEASSIGSETFGGFIQLASPDLSNTQKIEPYSTIGSYGVRLFGLEYQSGALPYLNGGKLLLDLSDEEGRGSTSGTDTIRRNAFLKYIQPLGANTELSFLSNLDNAITLTPYGETLPNIEAFGPSHALNYNPDSQSYRKYNQDNYHTDFEYLGLKSEVADGLVITNKVYTASYFQHDLKGMDVGGLGPNLGEGALSGPLYLGDSSMPSNLTGDVPGLGARFNFRAVGDVFRATQDVGFGQLRAGFWVEREIFNGYQYSLDLSRGNEYYVTTPTAEGGTPFLFNFKSVLLTVQPYIEFAWKPLPNLTVTAGVKYSSVTRSENGPKGLIGLPADDHATYNAALPSADARYRITPWMSAFVLYSKGFLTPPLNVFATTDVTSLSPSTTDSYQTGIVVNRDWLNLGVDLYDIEYGNFINSRVVGPTTTYFNQGGANYKGVEVEQTTKLPYDLSVYANGSLNDSSYYTNGNNLAQTPRRTAAAGLTYDRTGLFRDNDNLHAIIIGKYVGPQYALDTSTKGGADQYPIKSYNQFDLDVGYIFPFSGKRVRADVHVYDLFDNRGIIGYDGNTIGPPSQPLFWTNPGRSIYFSVKAEL